MVSACLVQITKYQKSIEDLLKQLVETPNSDYTKQELKLTLTELFDSVDVISEQSPKSFASNFLQNFISILETIKPSLNKNHIDNEIRHTVLEILTKSSPYLINSATVPELVTPSQPDVKDTTNPEQAQQQPIKPVLKTENMAISPEIIEPLFVCLLKQVLKVDNEANGVLALRYINTLFKYFKYYLTNQVSDFLNNFLYPLYTSSIELMKSTFSENLEAADDSDVLTLSSNSFKVLAECPVSVVSIFSSFKAIIPGETAKYLPLVMSFLQAQVEQQKLARDSFELNQVKKIKELMKIDSSADLSESQKYKVEQNIERYCTIAPAILNMKKREKFCDLLQAQIKCASFLVYIFLRNYLPETLQQQAPKVPEILCRLLQDLPSDLTHLRKELLQTIRHIFSTPYKKLFLPFLPVLLNEDVLLSQGFTNNDTLRTLALSNIADLIHNLRNSLSLDQIETSIMLFVKYLHDQTLQVNVHIMSSKLLINLVDCLLTHGKENIQEAPRARKLMICIIEGYVLRLKMLNYSKESILYYQDLYAKRKQRKFDALPARIKENDREEFIKTIIFKSTEERFNSENDSEESKKITASNNTSSINAADADKDVDMDQPSTFASIHLDRFDVKDKAPILTSTTTTYTNIINMTNRDKMKDNDPTALLYGAPIKDALYLYRTLLPFLKSVIGDLRQFNPPPNEYTENQKTWYTLARIFTLEETKLLRTLFHETLKGFLFFTSKADDEEKKAAANSSKYFDIRSPNLPLSVSRESRDLMESFVVIFMHLDIPTFTEIVEAEMEFFYECILEDSAVLHVAQSFLTGEVTSPAFNSILLRFLGKKLPLLGDSNVNVSNILIRLYKLSFMSVNVFPIKNEPVLLKKINSIILDSLSYSTQTHEPLVYFYLIRTLFRCIGGGKLENLYLALIPVLNTLLNTLNSLIIQTKRPYSKNLYVEICLTIPVKLVVLAPLFSSLIKPLCISLKCHEQTDLIQQGLRTLELCVDTFNADYLDPLIETSADELFSALFGLLKPIPANPQNSHTAVRILGKLGGRNRKFLKAAADLNEKNKYPEVLAKVEIYGLDSQSFNGKNENELESGPLGVSGWNEALIKKNIDVEMKEEEEFKDIDSKVMFPIASCVEDVLALFYDPGCETEYRLHAFSYLMAVLKVMIGSGIENIISDEKLTQKVFAALQSINENDFKNNNLQVETEKVQFLTKSETLLVDLLDSLFFASSIPELAEKSLLFLLNLADHFSFCNLSEKIEKSLVEEASFKMELADPPKRNSSSLFIKSLINSLGNYNAETRKTALKVTERLFVTSELLFNTQKVKNDSLVNNLLLITMFKEFIHGTTNEEFYIKCGSVLGLYPIIEKFSSSDYVRVLIKQYQIAIVSAMFFVLEDTKEEFPSVIVTRATEIISTILTLEVVKMTAEELKEDKSLLHALSEVICYLNSPTKATREASKAILNLISEKSTLSIEILMSHCRSLLLKPIFSKPLRALPIPIIIGNIEAVTYCLKASNDTSFKEELLRFLTEVIALVDADDNSLSGSMKSADYVISKQLVDLRVSCINLLSASVSNPEIAASNNGQTKLSILNLFFKTMTRDSDEIIDATYAGLKSAITSSTYKLPKEVLQPGLKPLLINLSDRENLSPYRLKALTRVLEILNSHFKLEVGKKLLDHLDWKSNIANLDTMADQDIVDQQPTIILTHIINMFHLLPNQADIFLRDLVIKVMKLENKLRCNLNSPFRKPLALFLNRFYESTSEYMTKNLFHRVWVSFICSLCQLPEAKDFYNVLKSNLVSYVATFQKGIESTPERCVSFYASTIDLVTTVHQMEGSPWLAENSSLIETLLDITMKVKHDVKTSGFYFDHTQFNLAINLFQELYVDLIKNSPLQKKTELFFSLMKGLFDSNIAPLELIKEYIFQEIVDNRTAQQEVRVKFLTLSCEYIVGNMEKELSLFLAENVVKDTLVFEGSSVGHLNNLLPTQVNSESIENTWIDILSKNVWSNETLVESNIIQSNLDFLKFQFINITASVVKWSPSTAVLFKTEIIKFGWNFIKMKDELCKQASYMLFSMFISIFDVSSKVITPLFVALLRNEQTEGRYMISQSLDMLVPVMHGRYAAGTDSEEWLTWVKWIRRVLSEEKSSQNLIIYHLLCGFPDQFFSVRELFVPNIINYLGKLFKRQSSALLENQNLAMDLLELILTWEEAHNKNKLNSDEAKMDIEDENQDVEKKTDSSESDESNASTFSTYEVSYSLRETCVSALIKYLCSASARNSDILINLKGLEILSKILSKGLWNDVNPSLDYYEKTLIFSNPPVDNVIPYIINYLQVFEIVLEQRPPEWIVENITYLSTLLQNCVSSDHQDIQRGAQKVLRVILKAIVSTKSLEKETENTDANSEIEDDDDDDNATEESSANQPCLLFVNNIVEIIAKNLNSQSTATAAGIMLAWTLFMNIPSKIDTLIPNILTVFSRLVNDHLQFNQINDPKTLEDARITLKLIEYSFFILCNKIAVLNDQRRVFLSLVASIIDKSTDVHILKQILRMFRYWAFAGETYPSIKEVSAILTRMLSLELKGESKLTNDYFELILSIFENRSELNPDFPIRMEHPFLIGTKITNSKLRNKFMAMLNNSIEQDIHERLYYIIKDQNWEFVADSPWLNQAIQLLYGSFKDNSIVSLGSTSSLPSLSRFNHFFNSDHDAFSSDSNYSEILRKLIENEQQFIRQDLKVYSTEITSSLSEVFYKKPSAIRSAWVDIFPIAYKSIKANESYGMNRSLVALLSKDYHVRQNRSPMNVIGAMLESFKDLKNIDIPPHLLKYLAITHNAWYEALDLLEGSLIDGKLENGKIQETIEDAILELYSTLSEKDMFYGLWRRRATYSETIASLSYEQIGLFDKAQILYESAQVKTRANALPYLESEYSLWEDGWIYCAQELQQWEILTDIAHDEAYTDLMVECAWRTANWNVDRPSIESSLKGLLETPTPRRQLLETFVASQKQFKSNQNDYEVKKMIEDGVQICLAKWETLPPRVSDSHIPLLHLFQEFTEMTELQMIYRPLFETNQSNIDQKSSEIKRVLSNWRERVPNQWDDLNIWNDLITWRTHVFDNINETYLPLLNALPKGTKNIPNYYYKGYHEVAWVINRFAKVARIQEVPEVCLDQLNKIYSLPNIEIHEAFLKLMEQAKCYYEKPDELNTGIEVIGNTNLTYFSDTQKAEFITMQGMFLTKKNENEKANESFVQAIKLDMRLAKAWAEWGHYHDKLFTENKTSMNHASSALSCYLQAAGLYNNKKSRQMISRILWFISLKDESNSIQTTFENSKTDIPTWYWITFIPQLLSALSHKEGKMARSILINIVKEYPQAIHFHLRTAREDYLNYEQQLVAIKGKEQQEKKPIEADKTTGESTSANTNEIASAVAKSSNDSSSIDANAANKEVASSKMKAEEAPVQENNQNAQSLINVRKQPWDYLDELTRVLKTSYPLLALTLEFLTDQVISSKKVVSPDETFYRIIATLLNEAHSTYQRLPEYNDKVQLPEKIVDNIFKQCNSNLEDGLKLKLVVDFVQTKPTFEAYIKRLRIWKNKIKSKLDGFSENEKFEKVFPYLSRFHQKKYEDIEVPGQYLLNKDTNKYFVKIGRFLSNVNFIVRGNQCYRVIYIRGQDGSLHSFAIETPSSRHARREERVYQMFRLFNDALTENVQTRKRNISFTAPVSIPFSPEVRLIRYSKDHLTLQDIFDKYCEDNKMDKDVIYDYYIEQIQAASNKDLPKPDIIAAKVEILSSIQSMFLSKNILKDFFKGIYKDFESFWLFRKNFTVKYSCFSFMVYMMSIGNRTPGKIHIDLNSGDLFSLELIPNKIALERLPENYRNNLPKLPGDTPILQLSEHVPFRLTPNLQRLIGDVGLEGIFSTTMLIVCRALLKSDNEMKHYLNLLIRDEVMAWYSNQSSKAILNDDLKFISIVQLNTELITRKLVSLSHFSSQFAASNHFVLDAISSAVAPRNLASLDITSMPYF